MQETERDKAMGRYRAPVTARNIAKRLKEGRGQGSGPEYNPYLHVQELGSRGLSVRVWGGHRTRRIHHYLSQLEYLWHCYFMSLRQVVDIREQVALLPQAFTVGLAEVLGIKHPTDPKSNYPIVLTTDIVVTWARTWRTQHEAFSVKPSKELDDARTLDKLSLELRYWRERGVPYHLVSEKELPYDRARNYHVLHHYLVDLHRRVSLSDDRIREVAQSMTRYVLDTDMQLRHITTECDALFGLQAGNSLSIAYHLIAMGIWEVDLSRRIRTSEPLRLLSAPPFELWEFLGVAA